MFGDDAIYDELEAWRRRDKHLYEFEANLRDQLQNRREDIYRVFAATMRRRYRAAIIEKLDLRDFHVLPDPDQTPENDAIREHTRDACLSVLIRSIKESMAKTVQAPPEYTTMNCHVCGSIEDFDHAILVHRCMACGSEWDQDRNAAINLLRHSSASAVPTV